MVQSVHIPTPRGVELEAVIGIPDRDESIPALIIAPGSGYSKEGPIIVELFRQAFDVGFACIRFDWHYTSAGGRPSSGRNREAEDLEAVLAYTQALPGVDRQYVILAGKSLGAHVAYRLFRSHSEIVAAALLTPVFRHVTSGSQNYPDLPSEKRPVCLLAGNRDSLNSLPLMHAYLRPAGDNVKITVVEGDHSLNVSRKQDLLSEQANAANISAAVKQVVDWLRIGWPR